MSRLTGRIMRTMKRQVMTVITLVVLLGVGVAQGLPLEAKRTVSDKALSEEFYREVDLFEHAMAIVRSDYVEEPQAKQLIYGAIKGMLQTLDPYSQFMDPDSYNELKVDTEGEFGGLGIEITIRDEWLTVISPIDDTPAYQAGLLAGDRIVKIDGELTKGIVLMDAVKKLRGKPGSRVTLTILREKANELKEVTIERAIIKIQSIREAKILTDNIGYIRLSDFRENTPKDLYDALTQLKEKGMDSMILDLRNNPGGLLDVSRSVSEAFLSRNQLIVTTKGRLRTQNLELKTRTDGAVKDMPLVVLINEGSASASEIVAGAIQDHRRGIILGMRSHGKASVQTVFPLEDGSALRLTTSKYFTPSGRSIHGEGIHPDVEVPLESKPEPSEEKDKEDKEKKTESVFEQLESPDKKSETAEAQKWDNQLSRAVDLLKGIKVYQKFQGDKG